MKKITVIIIIISISILTVLGLGYLFLQKNNIVKTVESDFDKYKAEEEIYFSHLSKHLLVKNYIEGIETSEGFILISSILSNKKDKVVYSEVSDSIKESESRWRQNIYVKDLKTGEKKLINSTIFGSYGEVSIGELFFSAANAGGCVGAYFPIAWSENDGKIILELANPTTCGSGAGDLFAYYTIKPNGGDVKSLAGTYKGAYNAVFNSNFSDVVYSGYGDNSPKVCGLTSNNNARLIHVKIEQDKVVALLGELNTAYEVKGLSDNGILTYISRKYLDKECAEINVAVPEEKKEISIY